MKNELSYVAERLNRALFAASRPKRTCIPAPIGAFGAFLSAALAQCADGRRTVLVVTPGIPESERLADDLRLITADSPVSILEMPPPLEGDVAAAGLRRRTIAALNERPARERVIVAPYIALTFPVVAALETVVVNTNLQHHELCSILAKLAYNHTPQVNEPGEYSLRGDIIDAWPPGEELPFRAEFFGEEMESLRSFDAGSQRSIAPLTQITLFPLDETEKTGETGENSENNEKYEKSPAPRQLPMELLPEDSAVVFLDHNAYNCDAILGRAAIALQIYAGAPAPRGVPDLPLQSTPLPGFAELGAEVIRHPELFEAAGKRLNDFLENAKRQGRNIVKVDELSAGFTFGDLVVVTRADRVFTRRRHRRLVNPNLANGHAGARIENFNELEPGEYVVHTDHGVGRFIGSSEISTNGTHREVFTIEYADGAKLHVPVEQSYLISRYVGVKGEAVRLHKLDGKRWAKDRANAQKAITDLAAALLETQAKRESIPGFAYQTDCDGHDAFAAAFPYEETPDQSAAIAAVEHDLAAGRPMDRLICGDAGYGKTEVAMRAAFIAAMNGRQTALLVPTTILAEQHLESFITRFDGTPIHIDSLSRMKSAEANRLTMQRIADGVCDIVIGTHALLNDKIVFHDLGLIIIDEEQRFGVRQKEFLKQLRATTDILTLSATPIPRTLYLSMTGARDLSVLRTPPCERTVVKTVITVDNDEVVRAAIDAELARGGQVFFLHNRIGTIGKAKKRLDALCPQARIVIAHGQLEARELAKRMEAFEGGKFDILLSTTIIEAGIDIPRANTIIVDRAETFGLAELYQLRGRVGRSARQGYAVFLLPAEGIDAEARERMEALRRNDGPGAGFNLALRDLELRGAGNLLGAAQSGHIAAIGFSLYCQLLQRTVAALKGENIQPLIDVRLNLDFIDYSPASADDKRAASLPYSYIEEDGQRFAILKRLAEAGDIRAINKITEEMKDRFGKPPAAAMRLIKLETLRIHCARACIGQINANGNRAILNRADNREIADVIDFNTESPDKKIVMLIQAVKNMK